MEFIEGTDLSRLVLPGRPDLAAAGPRDRPPEPQGARLPPPAWLRAPRRLARQPDAGARPRPPAAGQADRPGHRQTARHPGRADRLGLVPRQVPLRLARAFRLARPQRGRGAQRPLHLRPGFLRAAHRPLSAGRRRHLAADRRPPLPAADRARQGRSCRAGCRRSWGAMLLQALAKAPEDRFEDAAAWIAEIEELQKTLAARPGRGGRGLGGGREPAAGRRRQSADPGSTQHRLDRQFGLETTPRPTEPWTLRFARRHRGSDPHQRQLRRPGSQDRAGAGAAGRGGIAARRRRKRLGDHPAAARPADGRAAARVRAGAPRRAVEHPGAPAPQDPPPAADPAAAAAVSRRAHGAAATAPGGAGGKGRRRRAPPPRSAAACSPTWPRSKGCARTATCSPPGSCSSRRSNPSAKCPACSSCGAAWPKSCSKPRASIERRRLPSAVRSSAASPGNELPGHATFSRFAIESDAA